MVPVKIPRGYVEVRGGRAAIRASFTVALNVSAVRDNQASSRDTIAFSTNISGDKRQQEALMLAVESAPSGLLILDSERKIQSANRTVEKLVRVHPAAEIPDATAGGAAHRGIPAHRANAEAVSSGESAEAVGAGIYGLA